MLKRKKILLLSAMYLAGFTLFFTAKAYAANCTVTFSGISFGNYDALSLPASNYDVNGTITVGCQGPVSTIYITMSPGNSGTSSQRYMTLASSPNLNYNVYTDSARQNYWSDTPTTACTANNVCLTAPGTVTVYGRIPGGQDVSVGAFTDNLTATIDY